MKIFKIIQTIFYTLVILLIVLIAGSLMLTRLNTPIDYKLFMVQSGSMEPAIPMGSLVIVAPQKNYQVNDVITFRGEINPKETVTHRIVDISQDKDLGLTSYRTKGDANNTPDLELVRSDRVVGKATVYLPYLGYPIAFAQTQMGFIVLIVVPITIIVYAELVNIKTELGQMALKHKEKKRQKAEEKK
ncbi:signal peptidase I [Candidatus Beckwithbacteria bacterium]|nr:signal peptidase I [Candidatus Beckwithbacteria bacterium]